MHKAILLATLAFALTISPNCRSANMDTPEAVERAYSEAVRSEGITAIPDYIHPDELERFQKMLVPVFAGDTPRAKNLRGAFFGGSATPDSIKATSPKEFLRAFMEFVEGPMRAPSVNIAESEILGSVKEGEVVHLVTRDTIGTGPRQITQLRVVSLKPYRNSWRLLLSDKFEGMARSLQAQASAPAP